MTRQRLPFPGQHSSYEGAFPDDDSNSFDSTPFVDIGSANDQAHRHTQRGLKMKQDPDIWSGPFVDPKGNATRAFQQLLHLVYSWLDALTEPRETGFMELPKLAYLGHMGNLPYSMNIGLMDEVQAAHFFTALDVPYIFTAKSSTKEPHLALGEKGFQVWMARMLLANPKTTSGWLREVVKQMAKQPRTTWPPHTPSRIPKECFKVDLLKHRNARYKFDAAIAAASQAHTGDEEEGQDTEDGDREREALGLAEPARVSEALRLPETTGMHMPESTRAYPAYDGKGYPMNLPKSSPNGQAQQQHQGVQLVPVAQPMQPLAPRWLSGYSGQNASTFEPGRLQQGMPTHPFTNYLLANGSAVPGSSWTQQMDRQRMIQQSMYGGMGMGMGMGMHGMGGMMHPGMMGGGLCQQWRRRRMMGRGMFC